MLLATKRRARVPGLNADFLEQGVDEGVGLEQGQVFGLFADADVLDRQADLLADGDDDAALGGAVELGQDDARAVDRVGEM